MTRRDPLRELRVKLNADTAVRKVRSLPLDVPLAELNDRHKRLQDHIDGLPYSFDRAGATKRKLHADAAGKCKVMREGKAAKSAGQRATFRAAVKAAHEAGEPAGRAFPEARRIASDIPWIKTAKHVEGKTKRDMRPIVKELERIDPRYCGS